jgi:hypothetical protein
MAEHVFDHEKLDVYRLSIEYVVAGKETTKPHRRNAHAVDPENAFE